jgi:C-terminal processing protease CtpA/Prc
MLEYGNKPNGAMKKSFPYVLIAFLQFSSAGSWATGAEPDPDTLLKPDTPKFDNSIKPRAPLKGGVQHNAVLNPEKSKPLKAKVNTEGNDTLKGKTDNFNANLLKRRAKADKEKTKEPLSAEATEGIGIIGIKFVMAFGKPPVINRVFPGTPASEKGLRPDDIIVAVDGVPTFGLSQNEVYNMIIGTPNTPVTLSLRREQDFQSCKMNRMDFNDIKDPRVRRDYQNM